MKTSNAVSLLMGALLALAIVSSEAKAQAVEGSWGDLSYNQVSPSVEPLAAPLIMSDEKAYEPSGDELHQAESPKEKIKVIRSSSEPDEEKAKHFYDVSTIENTHGVMTEESPDVKVYVAPFAGTASLIGNDTTDSSPKYAAGAELGLLVSSKLMIELGFTHTEQDLSGPRINGTTGVIFPTTNNRFGLKQNSFDAGIKLFILGRESRLRPFIGGGGAYTRGKLDSVATASNQFLINQVSGFGELGAEFAFTRALVATASFRMHGILSSDTSGDTQAASFDANQLTVGNSLSRTASYLATLGVGIYF